MTTTAAQQHEILEVPDPQGGLRLELFVDGGRVAMARTADEALAEMEHIGLDRVGVEKHMRTALGAAASNHLGELTISEPVQPAEMPQRYVSRYTLHDSNVISMGLVWYDVDASEAGPEGVPTLVTEEMRRLVREQPAATPPREVPAAAPPSPPDPPVSSQPAPVDQETPAPLADGQSIGAEIASSTDEAQSLIFKHVFYSMGTGLVPLPFVDLGIASVVQVKMLKNLCELFDVHFDEKAGAVVVSSLASAGGAVLIAPVVAASFFKLIPGIGSGAGAVSMAVLVGASTYALGQVFLSHLREGGGLINFDAKSARQRYRTELKRGKVVAVQVRRSKASKRDD